MQNNQNNQYQNSNKPKKARLNSKAKMLIAAMCFFVVLVLQFIVNASEDVNIRMVATGRGVSFSFDSSPMFHSNDSRDFHFITRDGISFRSSRDSRETIHWSESFNFIRPISVSRGEFVAVSAPNARLVYVYNSSGEAFRVTTDYPIIFFSVNETGFLSVITQTNSGFVVEVYLGRRRFFRSVFPDSMNIPTSAEVSPSGRFIAIAVLDLNIHLRTRVQFNFINESDATFGSDGLFGEETFYGQVVSALRFIDNDRIIIATTSEIVCFQVETVQRVWEIELTNQIDLEFCNNRFAFVTGDRLLGDFENPDPIGMVRIFDMTGTETGYFNLGRRATHLRLGHGMLLVGADRTFHAINHRGVLQWEFTVGSETRDILFLENTDTVLLIGTHRAEIWERRRIRIEDEDFTIL